MPDGLPDASAAGSSEESLTLDTGVVHIARVYNYWLGGTTDYAADRAAAQQSMVAYPGLADSARANRAFLGRTVRWLARDQGIRQFLDIGTGIPVAGNTHAVAQAEAPGSRVVYADHDPIVLAHARDLLTSSPEGATAYLDGDLREPGAILAGAAETLDFGQPVAIVLMAVLQYVSDAEGAARVVADLLNAVPAGSYLVATHPASDLEAASMAEIARRLNATMTQQVVLRSHAEVSRFFDGLDLAGPGIVRASHWRPDSAAEAAMACTMWGGAGRKS
jgi:hypothetical protein